MANIEKFIKQSPALFDKVKFLKVYSPYNCTCNFSLSNKLDIINSKAPKFWQLEKTHGKEFTLDFLVLWIVDLNEYLNYQKPMTENQIKQTAILLFEKLKNMNIADLTFVWNEIKSGKYEFYGTLDGAKIIKIIDDYFNQRCDYFYENVSLREHDCNKKKWEYLIKKL